MDGPPVGGLNLRQLPSALDDQSRFFLLAKFDGVAKNRKVQFENRSFNLHLFAYLQSFVDEDQRDGLYIFTGSQQFEVTNNINQSLAGRTALVKLLPFSLTETLFLRCGTGDFFAKY
jgi:hypothetical protein